MVDAPPETERPLPPPERPGGLRRTVAVLVVLAALVAGAVLGTRLLADELRELVGAVPAADSGREVAPGQEVVVEVPPGASARQIGELLAQQGVIDSPLRFELAVRSDGVAERLQAGLYQMETGMGVEAALDVLLLGPLEETYRLTVIEGLWVEEILASLARQTPHGEDVLEEALLDGSVSSELLGADPEELRDWEGLLFPDTYDFEEEAGPGAILETMARTMERRVASLDDGRLEELGVSPYQAVIVASLVEAETRLDDERPLVASVIYNRLGRGMALEIDATVLYAVGRRGSGPTASELEVDSPYNTRRRPGLPPTPIGAPGLASLRAAFDPADTDYLYYVLVDPSGRHGFTESYDEFVRLKQQAREDGVIP